MSALDKLQRFFDAIDRLRLAHKAEVVSLGRVWYTDANAIVRQKVDQAGCKQRAPLLTAIVSQGVRDGVFTAAYPAQAGDVILALLQGMANIHAQLLLSTDPERDEQRTVDEIVTTHAAYMDAVERVLGAAPNSLYRTDAAAVQVWVEAMRENDYA